ncbi:hypothetical protein [Amycolatopsis thermophila]|uniref:TRAM domain-containing protein n=1 Tax=Amycolatopsis thermophila TaxID=206084 RepID=A0ABU0ETH1_9PSEU|nr:hypothetical protein [Amycolatopsis thermophila]MDQ0378596.1 hypothetical protein [Amycolatopsis thermophila]
MASKDTYIHQAFIRCEEPGCDSAGMVRGEVEGRPGDTVTVVSEGTCPHGHKLAMVRKIVLS